MKYTTILLDVDGTVVGRGSSPVGHNPRLQRNLIEFMGLGGVAGLVTGRSAEYTSAIHETFGLNGPRIVEKGAAVIFADGTEIKIGALENKEAITAFLKERGFLESMVLEPKNYMVSLVLPAFPHHSVEELRAAYAKLEPQFRNQNFANADCMVDDHSIDIENPNANKGEGILTYIERMDKDLERTAIVGDSRGDLHGFEIVGGAGGLVVYVGLDRVFASQLQRKFKNLLITNCKRSDGLVEALETRILQNI